MNLHKYGIKVPRDLAHTEKLDQESGNTLWQDTHGKEMFNVSIALEILGNGKKTLVGWTKTSEHLIWNLNMDFTRKARWVKDGHQTPNLKQSNYTGVMTWDSIRIFLTYVPLNELQGTVVQNAYLQAPIPEKHYVVCNDNSGIKNREHVALINRALYRGKRTGHDYWIHVHSYMKKIGFTSCQGDPDVWMVASKKYDGSEYWEYFLLCIDDCLVISPKGRGS